MKLKGLKREQRLNCEQLTLVAVRGAELMGFKKKKKKSGSSFLSQTLQWKHLLLPAGNCDSITGKYEICIMRIYECTAEESLSVKFQHSTTAETSFFVAEPKLT